MTFYASTLTALGTEAIHGAREATPAELAAATLACPEALWAVVDELSVVRMARWIDTYDGRRLGTVAGRCVAWVSIRDAEAWWEASQQTGVDSAPSVWRERHQYEPAPDPAAAEVMISELFRAAGWRVS